MWFRHFTFTLFTVSWCFCQVLITEIMYDLPGTDSPNEYVELYNAAPNAVSLDGWQIQDKYTTDDLVDTIFGFVIPGYSYALILEGDHDIDSSIYGQLIPENTVLFYVDDASIGNGLSGSDSLYLRDENGIIRESVGWSDVAPDGFSLERIRLTEPNVIGNWGVSLDSLGTPGFINSLAPLLTNGRIIPGSVFVSPDTIPPGTSTDIALRVTNVGLLPVSGTLEFYHDNDLIDQQNLTGLEPLDTLTIHQLLSAVPAGYFSVAVVLVLNHDDDLDDNQDSVTIHVRFPSGLLLLNEFLATPLSGQVEFVETVSRSDQSINLWRWSFQDAGSSAHRLPLIIVHPYQYLVLTSDSLFPVPDTSLLVIPSGWPALNNSGDAIRLMDPFGTTIDSVSYTSDWDLSAGISMEKRLPGLPSADSLNWFLCENSEGRTAGYRNSVMPWPVDLEIIGDSLATIPPFPGAGQTFHIRWLVKNTGQNPIAGYTLRMITDYQQIDTSLSAYLPPGAKHYGLLELLGHPGGYHSLRAMVDCEDDYQPSNNQAEDTISISFAQSSVLLNEFMAQPNNDQSEFIEWVANDTVNLFRWRIADSRSTSRPFPENELYPGNYGIVAADTLILSYMTDPSRALIDPSLPTLNNGGDWIRLLDHTGLSIDSLHYDDSWPVISEYSCEKVYPTYPSPESKHWRSSQAIHGTPGTPNSVTLLDENGRLLGPTYHNPEYPLPGDSLQLTVLATNVGRLPFSGVISVEHKDEEIAVGAVPLLEPRDTCVTIISLPPLPSGLNPIVCYLFVEGEDYPGDNILFDTVMVSQPFGTIRCNEFLPAPREKQVEFLEWYNPDHLDLTNWAISKDRISLHNITDVGFSDMNYPVLTGDSAFSDIFPGIPFIVPDDGWPALNNAVGALYIHDPTGFIVDSLVYGEHWPLQVGRSTEKFRPDYPSDDSSRWAVCVTADGATPGEQNSVYFDTIPQSGRIILSPNPFSPDGDGHDDQLTIQYKSPFASPLVNVQCYDILGRRIRTLAWRRAMPQESIITWDGRDDRNHLCRMAIYIIKVELIDSVTGKTWEDMKTVVLAKRL